MIDLAQDQTTDTAAAPSAPDNINALPNVTPDSARTQEVAVQHDNVTVIEQQVPVTARDDLGALNPPGADGFQTFAPVEPQSAPSIETFVQPESDGGAAADERFALTAGEGHTQVVASQAQDDQLQDTLGLPRLAHAAPAAAPAMSNLFAIPLTEEQRDARAAAKAHQILGGDEKTDEQLDKEATQRLQSKKDQGHKEGIVDLTPLQNFTGHRPVNNPKGQRHEQRQGKKQQGKPNANGKPAEGQEAKPKQAPKPQQPALVRSGAAQNYLREAFSDAGIDGTDHINTSSMAATKLGQALDINANIPFNHPDLGSFRSVGGLWFYIGMEEPRDEAFRRLSGRPVINRGRKVEMRKLRGFRTIVAEATWMKIMSNIDLAKDMAVNELPYRSYYTNGGLNLPQPTPIADWYVAVLEEIGRTCKAIHVDGQADAVPNFEFLERPERERNPRGGDRRDRPQQQQRQYR